MTKYTDLENQISETNGKVDSIVTAVEQLATLVGTLAERQQAPAFINRHLEADEQSLGGITGAATFADTDGPQALDIEVVGSLDSPGKQEKIAMEAFADELLEIHVHEVSDKDHDKVVTVSVNGQTEAFRRGEQRKVKRRFVEGLARAKPVSFDSEEYLGQDGKQHFRYPSHKGLRFPFSLVNPTPRDTAWLKSILAQP